MKKLLFQRVKEGITKLRQKPVASMLLMALAPLPLISPHSLSVQDSTSGAWNTELVFADTTPVLLTEREVPHIDHVSSRYEEAQNQANRQRRNTKRVTAKPSVIANKQPALAPSQPLVACNNNASESEKWEWANKAANAYSIPTNLLLAVWQIESGKQFCSQTQSYSGAAGPLQFMLGTWRKYAVDGNGDGNANVNDARDALFGAARLLAANGASSGDYRRALLAYNHASWYVNQVLAMANL